MIPAMAISHAANSTFLPNGSPPNTAQAKGVKVPAIRI